MIEVNKIYEGHALSVLKTFESKIFNTIVTSPPYYGLRAYGTTPVIWDGDENCQHEWVDKSYQRRSNDNKGQNTKQLTNIGTIGRDVPTKSDFCSECGAWRGELGSEPSPELFIKHLVDIFREAKRTLRDDGTLWVNMGDSYFGGGGASGQSETATNFGKPRTERGYASEGITRNLKRSDLKPKDLIGIPWMLAFALRADGWYLRMDNIWYKRNPMPESVTDRPTKAHEYFFLLSKSSKYYYDAEAIKTPIIYPDDLRAPIGSPGAWEIDGRPPDNNKGRIIKQYKTPDGWDTAKGSHGTIHRNGREKGFKGYKHRGTGDQTLTGHSGNYDSNGNFIGDGKANKRSVWDVPTKPFKGAHFATFPEELIVDCIKAGCPEGGLVLDPFGGANTTGLVSRKLNRNYAVIELNPKYIDIAEKRVYNEIGLFL